MRMVPRVNWPHVVNLGNSIIGVSILTMPFCFQQCGIILGTLLLLFCTWLTLISCQLLMKAGITSRRKSFEFLAYHILGGGGKFVVEFLLIGLQLGTMIAQIVVIGDLGPSIVSKITGFENTSTLRSGLIIFLCLFLGLPLGLLKNVRSLSHTSTMCVCFYTIFVVYMILLSLPNLWKNDWVLQVRYWRWDGFFQCIPIFSLAFGCQTQLFLLYDELPEPSFNVINKIVSSAVNICSVAYLLVGFFGYIAFCNIEITGDIINMLVPTFFTDMIKLSFVLSIAVTFPLIIFPCRTSLYTMLFPKRPKTSDGFEISHQIPELHFTLITFAIIVVSMVIGISVPNVEFILGLNGATMGTLICYIMPALFFLRVMSAASEGKGLSKFVLVVGVLILLTSTYTTLNSQDKSHHVEHQKEKRMKDNIAAKDAVQDILEGDKESHRHEPPIPKAPDDIQDHDESIENLKPAHNNKDSVPGDRKPTAGSVKGADKIPVGAAAAGGDQGGGKESSKESEKKQAELLHKLEEQQQEQKKILEEQRELLKELKKHREEEHKEKLVGGVDDVVGNPAIDRKFAQQQQPAQNVAQQQQQAQNVAQQQQQAQNVAQQQQQAQNVAQQQQQAQNVAQQPAQNVAQQQQPAQNVAQQQQQQPAQNVAQQQQQAQNVAQQQQQAQNVAQQQQPAQNVAQQQQPAHNVAQQQQPAQNVAQQQQPAQNVAQQQQPAYNVAQQQQPAQNVAQQQQPAQNVAQQQQPAQNVAQQQQPGQNVAQQQQPAQNVAQQQQLLQQAQNVQPQQIAKNVIPQQQQQNIILQQQQQQQQQNVVLQQQQQQQPVQGVRSLSHKDAQKLPVQPVDAKAGHQNKDSFIHLEKLDIAKQKLQGGMNNLVGVPVQGK